MCNDNLQSFCVKQQAIALPTILLFLLAWGIFLCSTFAGIKGLLPVCFCVFFNFVAAYLAYTVVHEASHYLVSRFLWCNEFVGNLALLLNTPTLGLSLYRSVHRSHHLFTNKSESDDPDLWLSRAPKSLMLFKWLVMDYYYLYFYCRRQAVLSLQTATLLLLATMSTLLILQFVNIFGLWYEFGVFYLLPTRIANVVLSWTFAYLPHSPHNSSATNDPLVTTNSRIANYRSLDWILLGHNCHILHHLQPATPFYRYAKAWRTLNKR